MLHHLGGTSACAHFCPAHFCPQVRFLARELIILGDGVSVVAGTTFAAMIVLPNDLAAQLPASAGCEPDSCSGSLGGLRSL